MDHIAIQASALKILEACSSISNNRLRHDIEVEAAAIVTLSAPPPARLGRTHIANIVKGIEDHGSTTD